MNKRCPDAAAALDGVLLDGMMIAFCEFGLCGIPNLLIAVILRPAGLIPGIEAVR